MLGRVWHMVGRVWCVGIMCTTVQCCLCSLPAFMKRGPALLPPQSAEAGENGSFYLVVVVVVVALAVIAYCIVRWKVCSPLLDST